MSAPPLRMKHVLQHRQEAMRAGTRSRRLSMVKVCATCGQSFRPLHKESTTCSHTCRGIRQARLKPQHFRMVAANAARAAQRRATLAARLEGLTLVEAYLKGHQVGRTSEHQRWTRRLRSTR